MQKIAANVISRVKYGEYSQVHQWMELAGQVFSDQHCDKEWRSIFASLRKTFGNKSSFWRDLRATTTDPAPRKSTRTKEKGKTV